MDIQVASNFERYLYYLYNENPVRVRESFAVFTETGRMEFSDEERKTVCGDFSSKSVTQQETLATIASFHKETGYLLDPHTAVGVKAALDTVTDGTPVICLATAHPAKFGDAVTDATGIEPPRPASLSGIESLPSRCEIKDPDLDEIRNYIKEKAL
jgi:threonine synthase